MKKQTINNSWRKAFNPFILFWLFIIGSIIGFLFEGVLGIIKRGQWENHSALVWGPFCIVYGIGAVLIYLIAAILERKNILIKFLSYFAAGAVVEYFSSLFQEIFFGSVSWDYSSHFMNIGGRVSLKMALIWGVFGIIFIQLIYPLIHKVNSKKQTKIINIITWICFVFTIVNIFVSSVAVIRWQHRQNDILPQNYIAQVVDKYFNDAYMINQYSNMRFISEI